MQLILSSENGEKVKVKLIEREVVLAKRVTRKFLSSAKETADKCKAPSFFYTLLVVAYVVINDYIRSASPEAIALILDAAYADDEKKKKRA